MEMTDLVAPPRAAEPLVPRGTSILDALRDECLADILAATGRRHPEHPALVFGSRTVTYRELDADSTAVAAGLAQLGVAPGQVTGLLLSRGADLLLAQAAITRRAAAWLPLDADTPLDRVKVCLPSAGAIGLVTTRE
jgi:non-ribosomal peptide synthetase component F